MSPRIRTALITLLTALLLAPATGIAEGKKQQPKAAKQDKVWIGKWDHGASGATVCSTPHPNCRFEQWQYALHAWFDKHLKRRNVSTGPRVEAFTNGERVYTADRWDPSGTPLAFSAGVTRRLRRTRIMSSFRRDSE